MNDLRRTEDARLDWASAPWVYDLATHWSKYWALWLALAVAVAASAVGADTALRRLATRWAYPYDHSYLVLGMSAWLLLSALRRAPVERVNPSFAGMLVLATAVLVYAAFETIDFTLGMQLVLPLILFGILLAIAGVHVARLAAIPVAMLYFTIPIWDLTVTPLQQLSVAAVTLGVQWSGLTAHIDGNLISIPAGAFEIAEGCSGMRYFMVALALAFFYGFNWYSTWRSRILLLLVTGAAAILANWIRIYTLIVIGDATDMQHYVVSVSHDGYGWLVFVLTMAPVLWFAHRLELRHAAGASQSLQQRPPARVSRPTAFLSCGALVAAAVSAPTWVRGDDTEPVVRGPSPAMPQAVENWARVSDPAPSWHPIAVSADVESRATFRSGDANVDVYVARYIRQRPGAKATATANRLSGDWRAASSTDKTVVIGADQRIVRASELASGDNRRVLWTWYIIGGNPTHSDVEAKLLELTGLLRGRRDGSVIALSAACGSTCETADAALADFLSTELAAIVEAIATGNRAEGT